MNDSSGSAGLALAPVFDWLPSSQFQAQNVTDLADVLAPKVAPLSEIPPRRFRIWRSATPHANCVGRQPERFRAGDYCLSNRVHYSASPHNFTPRFVVGKYDSKKSRTSLSSRSPAPSCSSSSIESRVWESVGIQVKKYPPSSPAT